MVSADPSFNCGRAKTDDEKAICSDQTLSQIDSLIAEAYRTYTAEFQSKGRVAKLLLHDRNFCGSDKICIAAVQWGALETFGGRESWVQNFAVAAVGKRAALIGRKETEFEHRIPTKPGECVKTRIKAITTRFGEPITYENADAGTSVEYENGGRVVSYDRNAGFYDAQAGQPVVFCLMTIPHDCPDGDDRGRTYYSLNLATKGEWLLSDTQHMCGGA